jgi:hypothetical protein
VTPFRAFWHNFQARRHDERKRAGLAQRAAVMEQTGAAPGLARTTSTMMGLGGARASSGAAAGDGMRARDLTTCLLLCASSELMP